MPRINYRRIATWYIGDITGKTETFGMVSCLRPESPLHRQKPPFRFLERRIGAIGEGFSGANNSGYPVSVSVIHDAAHPQC